MLLKELLWLLQSQPNPYSEFRWIGKNKNIFPCLFTGTIMVFAKVPIHELDGWVKIRIFSHAFFTGTIMIIAHIKCLFIFYKD